MHKPKRGDETPVDALLRAVLEPFSGDDVASNRAGSLSKAQRAALEAELSGSPGDQRLRWMLALTGTYLIFIPIMLVVFPTPIREVLCGVAVAVFLLFLGLMWLNVPSNRLRRPNAIRTALERDQAVAMVDAQAEVINRGGFRHVSLLVNGKAVVYRRLSLDETPHTDGATYRLYTLPEAGIVLSGEPLEDALPLEVGEPVILQADLPRHGLAAGTSGTVVDVYDDGEGYTVAFDGPEGTPVEAFPVLPDQLRRLKSG